jgi:hypothetical protein
MLRLLSLASLQIMYPPVPIRWHVHSSLARAGGDETPPVSIASRDCTMDDTGIRPSMLARREAIATVSIDPAGGGGGGGGGGGRDRY